MLSKLFQLSSLLYFASCNDCWIPLLMLFWTSWQIVPHRATILGDPIEQLFQGFSSRQKLQRYCSRDRGRQHKEGCHTPTPMINGYYQSCLQVIVLYPSQRLWLKKIMPLNTMLLPRHSSNHCLCLSYSWTSLPTPGPRLCFCYALPLCTYSSFSCLI